jgi:hypothetical protein
VQRKIIPLWGEKKVLLRQTLRAVSRKRQLNCQAGSKARLGGRHHLAHGESRGEKGK